MLKYLDLKYDIKNQNHCESFYPFAKLWGQSININDAHSLELEHSKDYT